MRISIFDIVCVALNIIVLSTLCFQLYFHYATYYETLNPDPGMFSRPIPIVVLGIRG